MPADVPSSPRWRNESATSPQESPPTRAGLPAEVPETVRWRNGSGIGNPEPARWLNGSGNGTLESPTCRAGLPAEVSESPRWRNGSGNGNPESHDRHNVLRGGVPEAPRWRNGSWIGSTETAAPCAGLRREESELGLRGPTSLADGAERSFLRWAMLPNGWSAHECLMGVLRCLGPSVGAGLGGYRQAG
jgi:hypothetical protein